MGEDSRLDLVQCKTHMLRPQEQPRSPRVTKRILQERARRGRILGFGGAARRNTHLDLGHNRAGRLPHRSGVGKPVRRTFYFYNKNIIIIIITQKTTTRRHPSSGLSVCTHVRKSARSGRACCCGGGFLLLRFPDAGVPRAAARDPRGARAVCDVRARVERRRELRVGGVVRLLRLARRACCCRLVSRSQRAPTGVKQRYAYPRQTNAYPGRRMPTQADDAALGHLPVTQPPQGAWGRNRPNCVPIPSHLHTITSRHPHAPPARAARSRRPLAPPVRAARSRRPLAPSAHAAASLHRRRTLMVSLDFPIPSHLHTITSRHPLAPPARAARSRRPLAPPARAARSRRPLAPPACGRSAAPLCGSRRCGSPHRPQLCGSPALRLPALRAARPQLAACARGHPAEDWAELVVAQLIFVSPPSSPRVPIHAGENPP